MQTLRDIDWAKQRLGEPAAVIYDWCRRNRIPHIRIGRRIKFDPGAVEAWIEGGGTPLIPLNFDADGS